MYNPDKPIKTSNDDLLGRSGFSHQLAEAIVKLSSADTFVVGLYGEWGSGKTSVLNLTGEVLREISGKDNNPKVTLVRFNPWGYTDASQLIQQFFSVLSSEVQSDTSGNKRKVIGDALEKYSFVLNYLKYIPVVGPFLTEMPELAGKIGTQLKEGVLSNENNIQHQKEAVKKALSSFHKKIVIFIDDIDRLPNDQIRMIFQLVNSVADFPNIVYVLSFDKQVVERALEEVQNCDGGKYLEKIVQIPFTMPDFRRSKLEDILSNKLTELVSDIIEDLFEEEHWYHVFNDCVIPYVNSMRDVIRLLNVLQFKYPPLRTEINPVDFIGITSIEVFLSSGYQWIKENKSALTIKQEQSNTTLSGREEARVLWSDKFKSLFGVHSDKFLKSVMSLFPVFASSLEYPSDYVTESDLRRLLRVGQSDKFDSYFTLSPESDLVNYTGVRSSLISMDEASLVSYMHQVIRSGLLRDYLRDARDQIQNIPTNRLELIVKAWFSILGEISNSDSGFFTLSSADLLQYLILDLLKELPNDGKRLEAYLAALEVVSVESFLASSFMLNYMELAQGRLAGDRIKDQEIVFSHEQLDTLEEKYRELYKKLLTDHSLLNSAYFHMASYVWKSIDQTYYEKYMHLKLGIDTNVLMYVVRSAHRVLSSNAGVCWSFSIKNNSLDLVSVDKARDIIQASFSNGSFHDLDEISKIKIASFVLYTATEMREFDSIPEKKAKEWLKNQNRTNESQK